MLSRVSSMVATAGSRASSASSSARSSSVSLHARTPFSRQNWLYDSFLANTDQYERLVTGSPRIGVAVLGYALIEPYINGRPDLHSPVHGGDPAAATLSGGTVNGLPEGMVNGLPGGMVNGLPAGAVNSYPTHIEFDLPDAAAAAAGAALIHGVVGVRKLHTWPLTKKEEARLNVWQV